MSKLRDKLQKRYESKDQYSNGKREQALDFSKYEVEFWKPKNKEEDSEGHSFISIVPYIIKTNKHPMVASGDSKIGEDDFMLDLWIHRFVGPDNADVICPKRNYGKPCPICEQEKIYRGQGEEDLANSCKASHRGYYNIIDENNRDKGIQIFQESYANFQDELMNDAYEDGEPVDFYTIKHGKAIKFRWNEKSFKGNRHYLQYRSFRFVDRDPLPKDILDKVVPLDECIVLHTYDEIKAIFYGEGEGEKDESKDESDEPTSKEDDDEEVSNEKDNFHDDDWEGDDDKPSTSSSKPHDDDEEKEEKKEVQSSHKNEKSSKSKECPSGYEFGKDCEKYDECDECDLWADCYAKNKEMKGKK